MEASKLASGERISVGGRDFSLQVLRFANGCFVSVSEGEREMLGGIVLSIKRGDTADSTTIVPPRHGAVFSTMLAQMAADLTRGMAIVTLYVKAELDEQVMKALVANVRDSLASPASSL